MSHVIISLCAFIGYSILLIILEILSRRYKVSPEWLRRCTHISGALFVLGLYFIVPSTHLLTLVAVFAAVMFFSHRLHIMKHIHDVSRKTIGEELLPLGFIAAFVISKGQAAIFLPSLLSVGIADPIGGIMVQVYKSHLLRSSVFALVTFLILTLFSNQSVVISGIITVVLTLVERSSPYGTDNLTIPVVASIALNYFS